MNDTNTTAPTENDNKPKHPGKAMARPAISRDELAAVAQAEARPRSRRTAKYMPHQGKRECERRLKATKARGEQLYQLEGRKLIPVERAS